MVDGWYDPKSVSNAGAYMTNQTVSKNENIDKKLAQALRAPIYSNPPEYLQKEPIGSKIKFEAKSEIQMNIRNLCS